MAEEKCGFREGRSCVDKTLTSLQTLEKGKNITEHYFFYS